MLSTGQKLVQLDGLIGTSALSDWETKFVMDVMAKVREKPKLGTTSLTDKQVEKIEDVWEKKCR